MFDVDPILYNAIIAGISLAIVAGPIGCIITWKNLAFFGDTAAHSSLLGVALGLLLGFNPVIGVSVTVIIVAIYVLTLSRKEYDNSTMLAVISHSTLAAGLLAITFTEVQSIDALSFLVGDILAIGTTEIYYIISISIGVYAVLIWRWNNLVYSTISRDLAVTVGINQQKEDLWLSLALAGSVAMAIQVVGVLLTAGMFVIPAASARSISKSPEQMAIITTLLGITAVILGLVASWHLDAPAGPAIIISSFILFVIIRTTKAITK